MGLSKLGQMIAVGGAAVGGFMKGKHDAEDRAREEEDRKWKQEQQGRLRKEWDDQDRIRSFTDEAADFISKNTSNPEQGGPAVVPQSTPAAQDATPTLAQQAQQGANLDQMSAPQQAAENPGLAEPAPQAQPTMTPVSPAVSAQMEGQSLEKRITQPKLPPQAILSLETLQGRDQKIAEGLAQLAAKHKVLPQYMEWSGKARQAADEGVFRASQALDQDDIEGAYKLFQGSGRLKLAEGNPRDMIVKVDDKGTYRLTLADGTKVERNIAKMRDALMSLPEYVKYTAENRKAALEERKADSEMKYRESLGKKAEADARFTDGARTASALAKGGGSGLQHEKWDAKQWDDAAKEFHPEFKTLPGSFGSTPDTGGKIAFGDIIDYRRSLGDNPDSATRYAMRNIEVARNSATIKGVFDPKIYSEELQNIQSAIKAQSKPKPDAESKQLDGSVPGRAEKDGFVGDASAIAAQITNDKSISAEDKVAALGQLFKQVGSTAGGKGAAKSADKPAKEPPKPVPSLKKKAATGDYDTALRYQELSAKRDAISKSANSKDARISGAAKERLAALDKELADYPGWTAETAQSVIKSKRDKDAANFTAFSGTSMLRK